MRIHGVACAILCAASLLTGCTSETGPAATAQLTNPNSQHDMGERLGGSGALSGTPSGAPSDTLSGTPRDGAGVAEEGGPSHLGANDPRN